MNSARKVFANCGEFPSSFEAKLYQVARYIEVQRPISKAFSHAVPLIKIGGSKIVGLLFRRRPSAIPRLVIPVLVRESVERITNGRLPHVFVERLKRVEPSVAHLYTSAAPVVKTLYSRVVTSGFSRRPCSICFSVAHSMRLDAVAKNILLQTSAGLRDAMIKLVRHNKRFVAALTTANPPNNRATVAVSGILAARKHDEPAERLTSKIFQRGHDEL